MAFDIILWIWFFIAGIAAAMPIPFIKRYTETGHFIWILLSGLSYVLLIYAYTIVLSNKNIMIVYPFLKVLSVLLVILFGYIWFHETLNIKTTIGIILGLASIYLLSP